MKKIIFLFVVSALLFSCKKNNDSNSQNPDYIGVYTSTSKDTVRVTKNGNYTKFVFTNYNSCPTPVPPPTLPNNIGCWNDNILRTFDSVRVASDLTFTDNEIYTTYNHPTGTIYPLPAPHSSFGTSTGTGSFGTNTIIIQFDALIFTGIKL